jgi:hypothetical protein
VIGAEEVNETGPIGSKCCKQNVLASVRCPFAFLEVDERYQDFSPTTIPLTALSFHSPARLQSARTPRHQLAASSCRHTPISQLLLSSFSILDILLWRTGQRLELGHIAIVPI